MFPSDATIESMAISPHLQAKWPPQTLTEKIAQKYAILDPGSEPLPVRAITSVGAAKVRSAAQLVYTLDHDVQITSPANLRKYAEIEAFAAEQGVSFYPKGLEINGTPETLASILIDSRLTISNMSTEWGALSCLFPIDETLEHWLRQKADEAALYDDRTTKKRINHARIDELFANHPKADLDAVATPLHELAQKNIKIDRAYLVSCTNSRASDIASAAKVFKDAAKANPDTKPKVADGVKFYISTASAPEQRAAEAAGDWQALVDAGAQPMPSGCAQKDVLLTSVRVGISASNRNFKGRMGSREAQAYLASPEVVAASALHGTITGPGAYQVPADWSGVDYGYGTGAEPTTEDKLANLVQQMDSLIERVESAAGESDETQTEILPGFPDKISGQITWLDSDNLSTDGIYPGTLTYRDDVTKDEMARACMQNYDPDFGAVTRPGDILVSGYNLGRGEGEGKPVLTRRTGWTLTWDVRRSVVDVQEGPDGTTWTEKVGELPATVQAIIAAGGLEAWIRAEVAKSGP
ncbi:hypothetical protein DL765_007862 [Monosporascus sp. GIB2]|nr:hypothetical protein DL765_007862 [Monosporascus sp. GIB2]